MADIKILKANGVEVHPVTHEDAVVNNLGLSVGFTLQAKSDTYLSTTAKTIVGGINEINAKKVLREADQGTVTGTNTSVKIISLKCGGARFYPVCHSDYVLHTDGKSLQSNINTLKTNNTNVTNRVSTLESTLKAIQTNNTSSNTTINTVSTNIGKLSDLQTSAKGNLVAAVNEINQFGSNLRSRLRTALINSGLSSLCSSMFATPLENASIDQMIQIIESSDVVYKEPPEWSYTVEAVSGAGYGFKKNANNERWVSQNYGIDGSAAVGKIVFSNPKGKQVQLYYRCYGENPNFDYGLISALNGTLSTSNVPDSGATKLYSTSWTTMNLTTATSGSYYIKYIKDGTTSADDDRLRFELKFV